MGGIQGLPANYINNAGTWEKWDSDGNNAGLVVLQDGAGNDNAATVPLFIAPAHRTEYGKTGSAAMGDIVANNGAALTDAHFDGATMGASTKYIAIPLVAAGYGHCTITLDGDASLDQAILFTLHLVGPPDTGNYSGRILTILGQFTMNAAGNDEISINSRPAGAVGGGIGADPTVNRVHYEEAAMDYIEALLLKIDPQGTLTAGSFRVGVTRYAA